MLAHRNGHQLVQRLQIPPMPDLPARTAGAETACRCGETVRPQRTERAWLYYCGRCGHGWEEPAPFVKPARVVRKPVKKCSCASTCRFCGGRM